MGPQPGQPSPLRQRQDHVPSETIHSHRLARKPEGLKPFFTHRYTLSLIDGSVLWGTRVIVLPQGCKAILNELHETHPGASCMKSLARAYIWWLNMDADIEQLVRACSLCQESYPAPPSAPLHPWSWPSKSWSSSPSHRFCLSFHGKNVPRTGRHPF